ncbi:MAG TPA: RNA polymerase sigma factor [Tepidisphaeraceae bacterium]|nr:RNA polymerase sigma factor [Tepidisphaeraceae bacterium]
MDQPVDRDSFDRLMVEHLPGALRLAVRLVGDVDRAEELVQEAMLRGSRGWQGFRGQSKFTTWLFQIVINVFRDQLRRRGASEELSDGLPDVRPNDPREIASSAEMGELVARHVSSLPPRQREVLVLVVYEQYSQSQAADLLQISLQNVRTNLHLARQTLKKQLAVYLGEDHGENGTRPI